MLSLLITSAFSLAISCNQLPKQLVASDSIQQKTTSTKSRVTTDKRSYWKWRETRIGDAKSLDYVQFLNADQGFASSADGSLYKTLDGGRTWQQIMIESPPGRSIAGFQFVTSSIGWLISNKNSNDTLVLDGYESYVMFTSDGGKSWQIRYSDKSLQIWQVRFVDEQEGWAVGRRFVVKDTQQDEVFVLHTTNQGKNWVNVSKNFPAGTTIVTDVYAGGRSKALMLSDETVFSTTSGGESWQKSGTIADEPPQTAFLRIGVSPSAHVWVLGGADSREGMWMMFARLESANSWKKHEATGVYLRDAVFLSENEVLACGRIFVENSSSPVSEKRDGVIVYSSDGGQNWAIVYRSSKVSDINGLSVAAPGNIVAVGDDGIVLCFRRAG
ncbi:MAG: YCF48-related protein [Pyrinomonadaceae bacterium]|nr:YCF48-related protein [Pyrinomonadaceae bacterium]